MPVSDTKGSVVYMTTDTSPEGLMAVYEALGWMLSGNVAVKLNTGEPPASNYLRPELIADLVQSVDGTIVECNTAYSGSRAETAMHYQVVEDHGFTAIADFRIQDEDGSTTLPVEGGTCLTEKKEERVDLRIPDPAGMEEGKRLAQLIFYFYILIRIPAQI